MSSEPQAAADTGIATSPSLEPPSLAPPGGLLAALGLCHAFGGQVILDHVDLELRRGEVVLLRGENGSGKTTLLNILTGNLEPNAGTIHYCADGIPHSYRFPRRWWQGLNPLDKFTPDFLVGKGIGRTWQDIRLFGGLTVRDNIAVAHRDNAGESPLRSLLGFSHIASREATIHLEAEALLNRLDLGTRGTSSADKISLGQAKRIAIARAVTAGARVLFLDEPLAGLDRAGIDSILELLDDLVRDSYLSLVIVEHVFNQFHLRNLVSTHWLLRRGILTTATAEPAQIATNATVISKPDFFEFLSGNGEETIDQPLPRGAFLTRVRRPGRFQLPPVPTLEARNLTVRRGSRVIIGLDDQGKLAGFDFAIYEGEIAILQAPNGWGKSTLFSALTGLIPIDSGEIYLEGHAVEGLPPWERVRRGLRAQPAGGHTFPSLRVEEALWLAGASSAETDAVPLAKRLCSSLSGGERQRVAICQTVAGHLTPALLLLDEPFSAFDRSALEKAFRCVAEAPSRSLLILIPSTLY